MRSTNAHSAEPHERSAEPWWRTAVIYQVYPRSFADSDGDGVGDLPGIASRLNHIAALGADAVWLSPFYRSPQNDAGYDVADYCAVDPRFGTLRDFDTLVHRAHNLGLRVIVDIVPNHSSSEHIWFQEALASAPGSPERARYIFAEGKGPDGALPPNNWVSMFGGPAWTRVTEADGRPGQWYLHLFDSTQPDFDWNNPWVADRFDEILRFWLERGVDGFRIDVAHGLAKAEGLPDTTPPPLGLTAAEEMALAHPHWGQEGSHKVWRRWRALIDQYDHEPVLVAEAWINPLDRLAQWVRPDELHQAFNFEYLLQPWDAASMRGAIDGTIAAFEAVGAPSSWVLSNHDTVRHATRLGLAEQLPLVAGVGPRSTGLPDEAMGILRARAATLVAFALPGSTYVYQGEELGLPEVIDIADDERDDPTFFRSGGEAYGRDGCRVPIPWEADAPAYGFSPTGASWLPQPASWATYAADQQTGVAGSTLEMYRTALRLRRELQLGSRTLAWEDSPQGTLAFTMGDIHIWANTTADPVDLPRGANLLLSSQPTHGPLLPNMTAWWQQE
jgi:alpha-glucosidase